MKRLLIAAAMAAALAVPAFAAEGEQPARPQGGGEQTFEQRKARMLEDIDQRIADMKEDRDCLAAAKDQEELKTCFDKRMEKMRARGVPGGPRMREGRPDMPPRPGRERRPAGAVPPPPPAVPGGQGVQTPPQAPPPAESK